jgi:RHS repeat-associated protein
MGTTDTPFLFNGRYGVQTDANGLLYMRARYYNPYISRFINADPSGFNGGLNFYAFADGNPISEVDPFGLGPWTSFLGGLRAIGGGLEAAGGYTLAVTSGTAAVGASPTVVGAVGFGALAVGGAAVGAHGVDTFQAGIRQMWTGQPVDSLTSLALQSAGMSQNGANLADAGASVVGSLGTGFATTAIRATSLSSTSISAEVANAPLLTKMAYYEVGQTSLSRDAYTYYSMWGNTLDRGAAMVADQGWAGALGQGSLTLGAREGTLFTTGLPTPLGMGLGGAAGSAVNWLGQPVSTSLSGK